MVSVSVSISHNTAGKYKTYIYDNLLPYWPACALRSSDQQLLQIPYMHTEFGQRSFSYCSPKNQRYGMPLRKLLLQQLPLNVGLNLTSLATSNSITQSVSLHLATAHAPDSRFSPHCAHYELDYYYITIIILKTILILCTQFSQESFYNVSTNFPITLY